MKIGKLILVLAFCVFNIKSLYAQPVNATLQLFPPNSPYLADFTEPATQSLLYTLTLLDNPSNTIDVKLQMTIDGAGITLTTNNNWVPPVMTLSSGIPALLNGYDLIEYFDPYHLDFFGMTREEFINGGGILPEGYYEICIQAFYYDPGQGQAASNNACASTFLQHYDPPQITTPIGIQTPTDPQLVLFNWLPMHNTGDFITEYDLQIWRKIPGLTVQQILDFEYPLYETTTTNLTTFQYGLIQPDLREGEEYITRVRARAQNGAAVFHNDGYSEVELWSWGEPLCFQPGDPSIGLIGEDTVYISWRIPLGNPVAEFVIRYRDVEDPAMIWTEIPVNRFTEEYYLTGLGNEGVYEFEIRTICSPGESDWLNLGAIVLGDGSLYYCGLEIPTPNLDPSQLLASLNNEDIVIAGDFRVVVTNASGGNGRFWGDGYINVPYLNSARVNVQFNAITVNNSYQMIDGIMNVTGAGLAIINTEMAEWITNILETLEDLDDLLAVAEDLLTLIDQIIAQIEPYLPDDIIQDLLDAQALLEQAQEMAANGDPGAEDALQQAQDALNAANAAYVDAIQAFMENFLDILRESFIQLHNEYADQVDLLEDTFNISDQALTDYLNSVYDPIFSNSTEGHEDSLDIVGFDLLLETTNTDSLIAAEPHLTEYITKSGDYMTRAKVLRTAQVIKDLKDELTANTDIDGFVAMMKGEDLDLLEIIGTDIKNEVEPQQTIDKVKEAIVSTLGKVIAKVAYLPPE